MFSMTDANTFDPKLHPRDPAGTGQFTQRPYHPAEATIPDATETPLTEGIADYLRAYDEAQESYSEAGEEDDDAYEYWEDFQTDNSGHAYDLLAKAKSEIERLQAELAQRDVPQALRDRIDNDYRHGDEPLIFIPEGGSPEAGYADAIAVVDGQHAVKYTLDPDGDITSYTVG